MSLPSLNALETNKKSRGSIASALPSADGGLCWWDAAQLLKRNQPTPAEGSVDKNSTGNTLCWCGGSAAYRSRCLVCRCASPWGAGGDVPAGQEYIRWCGSGQV